MSRRVLIVDDEKSIRDSLKKLLSYEDYRVFTAPEGNAAIKTVRTERVDLVLLDIKMPGMDGIEVLEELKKIEPHLPVIIISGHGNIETAVKATKLGAYDFIEKPIDLDRVLLAVRNGIRQGRLARQNVRLKKKMEDRTRIIGEHPSIEKIMEIIRQVAPTSARVLITGENGTGKELVARKIHELSDRAQESFIEVNCAAIPEELIESELFGHEKGAFTGATGQRIGKFELADEGTLFLDEVGDMSLSAQAKVLRVLQESVLERVGGSRQISVDVRVIAASNKNLEEEIEKGRFRKDLFFRLNVVPVEVIPLRERVSDIPVLASYFLSRITGELGLEEKTISAPLMEEMKSYHWPGNVRELRNVIERICILSRDDEIGLSDIPSLEGPDQVGEDPFRVDDYNQFKELVEKKFFMRKLRENEGNVSKTARKLGMQRSNLYNKLNKYEIDYRG
ncbi:MAG: response regulator [Candidatus Latescibacteria bacterium]|nr:response regulator [bacterium]MBD3424505.1 response regulator [Candidatus Latescibacterota bacterium]